MDFEFTQEEIEFRKDVENLIKAEIPSDWDERVYFWPGGYGTVPSVEAEFQDFLKGFLLKLGERHWLTLSWPVEYGGGGSVTKQAILDDVLSYYRTPSTGVATSIAGPTIAQVGSEEMKKEWLPKLIRGETSLWLGYSEPDAGSDLGSIRTTAIADGDDFIINGQKIWSTGAHVSDYCWLLAKTDPDAEKHKGATLFIVDNNTPGITINPLINICGIHSFNEVFFDNVRVSKKNIVGEINRGFYNVMLALQYERLIISSGAFRRILHDLIEYVKKTNLNGETLSKDPRIRNRLASMAIEVEALMNFYWYTAWLMDKGLVPELETSVLKLYSTELGRSMANMAIDILGPYGQLEKGSPWAPLNGRVSIGYLDSLSGPIGAGTSEVQRGIIATRGMGLPRG